MLSAVSVSVSYPLVQSRVWFTRIDNYGIRSIISTCIIDDGPSVLGMVTEELQATKIE